MSKEFTPDEPTSWLNKPINMFQVTEHFGGEVIGEATTEQKELFVDLITRRRAAILEMESQEEGLNLGRVDEYRKQLGIPRKEVRFLNPTHFAQVMKNEHPTKKAAHDNDETLGEYFPSTDLIVIKRDPVLEDLNGPEFTESIAGHEIVHSDTEEPVFEVVEKTIGRLMFKKATIHVERPRSGYIEKTKTGKHLFIEEGLADYERGQYVENILTRPGGFAAAPGEDFDTTNNLPIPGKYWYMRVDENGKPEPSYTSKSAIAAATLELIINENPDILPLLREGRTTHEGSRIAAPAIDALKPGLFNLLNDVIIDDTYQGMSKAVGIFADVYKTFVDRR